MTLCEINEVLCSICVRKTTLKRDRDRKRAEAKDAKRRGALG